MRKEKLGLALAGLLMVAVALASGCLTAEKTYCTPESREVDTCFTLYKPVCGYSSPVTFKTYANDCVACIDANVEYYTEGKCLIN